MLPSHHISHTNTTRYLFMQHLLWELMYILSCHQISSYSSSYVTIFSYQIITDNNYTFSLAPWTDDARCQIQAWKVPVTIDIHGIPPHAFHIKSLSIHCQLRFCLEILREKAVKNSSRRVLPSLLLEVCVIPAQKLYDLQKQSSTFELKEVFYQGVTKRTNKR